MWFWIVVSAIVCGFRCCVVWGLLYCVGFLGLALRGIVGGFAIVW